MAQLRFKEPLSIEGMCSPSGEAYENQIFLLKLESKLFKILLSNILTILACLFHFKKKE